MRPTFARIYDRLMAMGERGDLGRWRRDLVPQARGEVLEIGAGTGANLPHYGPDVTRLVLTEPNQIMRRQLEARCRDHPDLPAEIVDSGAAPLPFDDESFDTVVSTLVLCSVPDVDAAVAEARRVLRPGGRFLYLEHVLSEAHPRRAKWQRRLQPAWLAIEGSCHLARPSGEMVAAAGFERDETRREMTPSIPVLKEFVSGVATKPT